MFSKYKCSVQYDLTRFRTGEIPIYFGTAVGTYNTLMSYYDIRGLWEMAPLCGIEQKNEDGTITINRTSHVAVSSRVIPRGGSKKAVQNSWEYIKWMAQPATQKLLGRETIMVSANPTTKYNAPTIDALLGQAWTDEELAALREQTKWLAGIPEYPGNYIIGTYVNSAFMNVYNTSSDAAEQLQDRVVYINKEIARKRDDFKMDYIDITGKYHPGRYYTNPAYKK
jgi:ABC-type glycerol-3-phosphate transport system substrate-binding protein